MAGVVISKTGTGGITINIPLQFDSLDHLTRVITDGFTTADAASALQLPDSLKSLVKDVAGEFSALPPVVSAGTMEILDIAQNVISGPDGMKPMVHENSTNINNMFIGWTNSISALNVADTFEEAQLAMAAWAPGIGEDTSSPWGWTEMGGVMQALTEFQKFLGMTRSMQSEGPMGIALGQLNSIAKNAGMISAMGNLASAVASECGLPAPPSVDDAFALLQDGEAGSQTQALANSMRAVQNVLETPVGHGTGDDMNDVVWQNTPFGPTLASAGTYLGALDEVGNPLKVMQVYLKKASQEGRVPNDGEITGGKSLVNIPGWVNPSTGLQEYISDESPISAMLGGIESALLGKVSTVKAAIEKSLAPLEDLASGMGLAAISAKLPSALMESLPANVKEAMEQAGKDIMSSVAGKIPSSGQSDGRPAEEGGSGPHL